jgi:signal transduction histidine kinase/CheY-like chemotaxis protein
MLKSKASIVQSVAALLLVIIAPILGFRMLIGRIESIERQAGSQMMDDAEARLRGVMNEKLASLERTAEDWSAWDAMYQYALAPAGSAFGEENFTPDSIAAVGLSHAGLYDVTGSVIRQQQYDHVAGSEATFPAWGDRDRLLGELRSEDPYSFREGLVIGPDGRLSFVLVKQVRRTDKGGAVAGRLMMVRPLLSVDLEAMSASTGVHIRIVGTDLRSGGAPVRSEHAESRVLETTMWDGAEADLLEFTVDLGRSMQLHEARVRKILWAGVPIHAALVVLTLLHVLGRYTAIDDGESETGHSRAKHQARVPYSAVTMCLGVAGSAVAFSIARSWEHDARKQEFTHRAMSLVQQVRTTLRERANTVEYARSFLHSSTHVTFEEFERLVLNAGLLMPGTAAIAWLPEGGGSSGTDVGEEMSLTTPRILPVSASTGIWHIIGADGGLREHLASARDSGEIITRLLRDNDGRGTDADTFIALAAVYREAVPTQLEFRRREYRGSLVFVFSAGDLLSHATMQTNDAGTNLTLHHPDHPDAHMRNAHAVDGVSMNVRTEADLGGTPLVMTVSMQPTFHLPGSGVLPPVAAFSGLIATAGLSYFLYTHARRTRRIEAMVKDRTAELRFQAIELQEARFRAESASRAKSTFLANMSHELRTPITAILGYADLLYEDATDAASRASSIAVIRRSGEHLLQLIGDVLDLSKVEAGKLSIEPVDCSPRAVVDESLVMLREQARSKGLSLEVEYDGWIPERFRTDPTRLTQILVNLVSNAIKFTETGGVKIRIGWSGRGEQSRIRVEVSDTGIGMDAATVARLFQPFEQGDNSTTRKFGGTGLGLAISRQLARMLGGDIDCKSTVGVGSTFRLTIRAFEHADGLDPAHDREAQPHGAIPDRQRPDADHVAVSSTAAPLVGRVLLVDDTLDNQRLLAFHLQRFGFHVTIAPNGREAVDATLDSIRRAEPFDLIFMDMQMPVMDGREACIQLRSAGYRRPIVALTAHESSVQRDECLSAGCNDFVSKPVSRERLRAVCERWIAAREDADSGTGADDAERRAA